MTRRVKRGGGPVETRLLSTSKPSVPSRPTDESSTKRRDAAREAAASPRPSNWTRNDPGELSSSRELGSLRVSIGRLGEMESERGIECRLASASSFLAQTVLEGHLDGAGASSADKERRRMEGGAEQKSATTDSQLEELRIGERA